jgi:hypothetical protein
MASKLSSLPEATTIETDDLLYLVQSGESKRIQGANAASIAAPAITAHNIDTTSVHGIADTSLLSTSGSVNNLIASHNSLATAHGLTANISAGLAGAASPGADNVFATMADAGAAYKVYAVVLNQTGVNAPIATILENTLSGIPVWTRSNLGEYMCTLLGAFPPGKTIIPNGGLITNDPSYVLYAKVSNDVVAISVLDGSLSPQELGNYASNFSFEIKVYP